MDGDFAVGQRPARSIEDGGAGDGLALRRGGLAGKERADPHNHPDLGG